MKQSLRIDAIIPARAGSKRVPAKNIRMLGNKPMIRYTIESAMDSKFIENIYVSSNDPEVKKICSVLDCHFIDRPENLSTDDATTESVIDHFLAIVKERNKRPDILVILQPTVPFREPGSIDCSIETLIDGKFDSVTSHIRVDFYHPNKIKKVEGDQLAPYYEPEVVGEQRKRLPNALCRDGSIYALSVSSYERQGSLLGCRQGYIITDAERFINVDTMKDWLTAEALHKYYFS